VQVETCTGMSLLQSSGMAPIAHTVKSCWDLNSWTMYKWKFMTK